jgi:hypothetical protein
MIDANMYNTAKFFYDGYEKAHVDMRRDLATALINNPYVIDHDRVNWDPRAEHVEHKQAYSETR